MGFIIKSEQPDGPYMLKINSDGLIYSPIIHLYVRLSDLQKLKEAIDLTLEVYKTEGINDLIVDQMNKEQSEKEYEAFMKSSRIYSRKPKDEPTTIYIMIDHNTGFYKIGHSKNVLRRESTLQSEKPTIELLYTFEGIKKDEKDLHENYKDLRVRGEWFALEPYMVENIIKHFEFKRKTKERREQRGAKL